MSRLRVAVVGGGIIGTATARHLAQQAGARVTLFEAEQRLGAHQTGHNSGVVHAGLYYPPGSLKARLCRRGVDLLTAFAERHAIAREECGKVVVALDATDAGRLDEIHRRAQANGVPGLRMLDADGLRDVEPHAVGVRALHSPHTAIIDFAAVTEALAAELADAGGELRLGSPVTAVRRRGDEALVESGGLAAYDLVVTCAGLQSDRLARASGGEREPRIVPFAGDYWFLADRQTSLVRGLVYPVPDPRYPFLGVHLTRRVDGRVMLGPNAFLASSRAAYREGGPGWRTAARDLTDAARHPGLWRFAAANLPAAGRELRTALGGQSRGARAFVAEARRYVPEVDPAGVTPGPRGIRAQAMTPAGALVDDFAFSGDDRVLHVRNAPSPGATSALAIAEHVAAEALARVGVTRS